LFTHAIQEVPIPPGTLENYPNSGVPVWGPFPSFSGAPGGFLMSPGGPFEVRRVDRTGAVTEILRYAVRRVPATDELKEWGIDSLLTRDQNPERSRIYYGIIGVADSLPSVARLYPGADGGIWIERYPSPPYPFQPPEREFFAAASDGAPVAWVTIPGGFSPLEFGPDWVLGVGRDEFDVRYVRRYRFVAMAPQ
jgi:hypothetical protein